MGNFYNLGLFYTDLADQSCDHPALCYPDRCISQNQLSAWVDSLTALLLEKGCSRGDVITIAQTKHPLSYALMHAALRLGVAYVIIDVDSPTVRNSRILKLSGSFLLFYDNPDYSIKMEALAENCNCRSLLLSETELPTVSKHERNEQLQFMKQVDGSTIAYIMFTSGSTGIPKGVAVTHQNVLHFISWGREYFGISNSDNFANLSPMYFDNSVFDFYVGMFSGASLTPVSRSLLSSPYELVSFIEKMNCTIWFSVPSLLIYLMTMKTISADSLPRLRSIIFGGEGYPKIELKKLYDCFFGRAQLFNVYGPTECTCICSAYEIKEDDFSELSGLPPLGQLNQNFDFKILDDEGKDSDIGELCLIGPNVAAGYFNDLQRTDASFFTLTDSNRFMKRMYRTGDLVRQSAGVLFFTGRKDNQVKHMGYRIELEEIEHALVKLDPVDQAAVIYHRTNTAYGKIVGFVACSDSVENKLLVQALSDQLPEYMVPSKLIVMETLPKNPNGKIDRRQLHNMLEI